jgi:hypothetical protein
MRVAAENVNARILNFRWLSPEGQTHQQYGCDYDQTTMHSVPSPPDMLII